MTLWGGTDRLKWKGDSPDCFVENREVNEAGFTNRVMDDHTRTCSQSILRQTSSSCSHLKHYAAPKREYIEVSVIVFIYVCV